MSHFLPYGRQTIDQDDMNAVMRVLRSDFLTCGPEVDAFEEEFASYVGARHAVAVANATDALHLAMRIAGISQGDRVVTSPNTFLASANCAAFVGAIPDFADVDPISGNLDPNSLAANWKADTKAVVAVDYAGQPANMPEIARIARDRGAIVIEDACHGTGGGFFYQGRDWRLGGHPWADITTFSFHPVKTLTTGEGGIIVTDNDEYARLARQLRSHGIERNPLRFVGFGSEDASFIEVGPWVYEMHQLGYNHRITDMQCALGRSQLRKLDGFINRRAEIVESYNQGLAGLNWLQTPRLAEWLTSSAVGGVTSSHRISWHLYTVSIDFLALGISRAEVMSRLRSNGVGSQVLYIPVHMQPWYRETYGYSKGKCPVAEAAYARSLSLPLYPCMSDEDVSHVIRTVLELARL